MSDTFSFGLFDLDWEVFTQHIEGAINRVPVLEKTGVKSTVCGPGEWAARERLGVPALPVTARAAGVAVLLSAGRDTPRWAHTVPSPRRVRSPTPQPGTQRVHL